MRRQKQTAILGVDFTSRPRPAKPITVAHGQLNRSRPGLAFELNAIESLTDWASFEALLLRSGPWIGGFDFPFGLPRAGVADLGWPQEWHALVTHCAAMGRESFRAALDRDRTSRAVGSKYPHRATDLPAKSHSPFKLVNPPVGLMFFEGAPRLLAAGVDVPGLAAGDSTRIALEAYPGLAARWITNASYKSDDRAKQTLARTAARASIVRALIGDGGPFGFRLRSSCNLRDSLTHDASGDRLDAVLAAMQAAWAYHRRLRHFGLPRVIDPIEGWIVMA